MKDGIAGLWGRPGQMSIKDGRMHGRTYGGTGRHTHRQIDEHHWYIRQSGQYKWNPAITWAWIWKSFQYTLTSLHIKTTSKLRNIGLMPGIWPPEKWTKLTWKIVACTRCDICLLYNFAMKMIIKEWKMDVVKWTWIPLVTFPRTLEMLQYFTAYGLQTNVGTFKSLLFFIIFIRWYIRLCVFFNLLQWRTAGVFIFLVFLWHWAIGVSFKVSQTRPYVWWRNELNSK